MSFTAGLWLQLQQPHQAHSPWSGLMVSSLCDALWGDEGGHGAVSISTSPVAQEPFPAFPIGAGTASIWGEVGTGCESPGRLGVSRVCSQALRPGGTLLHLSGPAVAWGPRAGAAEGQQQGEEKPDTGGS